MSAQLTLVSPPVAPVPPSVDLRCCSCTDVDWPEADLVLTDPPWVYERAIGDAPPYAGLSIPEIVAHLDRLRAPRLAMWCTGPKLGEWVEASRGWSWGRVVSVGVWAKVGGAPGQGYHWSGDAELLLMYSRGGGHIVRGAVSNRHVSERTEHSRKPVDWQTQIVRAWVPEGGLVLDPYAGLASTAEAVLRAGGGRRCLTTEIDPDRYERARGYLALARVSL